MFPCDRVHDFDENTKGIPEFWLTIFKNVDLLAEMVQDYDEPILKHLVDIQLKFHDEPMGFTLEFHFSENEYFTNKILTKYYEMKCVPDKEDPFGFEGPEIFKCKVCQLFIYWFNYVFICLFNNVTTFVVKEVDLFTY